MHPFGPSAELPSSSLYPLYLIYQLMMKDNLCEFCDQWGHKAKDCPVKKAIDNLSKEIPSVREAYGSQKHDAQAKAIKKKADNRAAIETARNNKRAEHINDARKAWKKRIAEKEARVSGNVHVAAPSSSQMHTEQNR